ncbi:MAG: flagellar hook assembly protein FlgD [Verrucomicrobiae bacterium]|nr:flagellar hook assembly protein FlgD [Verrucomicrobiae bacterium]
MSAIHAITPGVSNLNEVSRIPVQTLNQEDFLKLLVTQLTTQDPMAPKQDTDFFAEMATFSTLEQTRVMQADIALLRADQQITQATGLLGRTVEVSVDEETRAVGTVDAIQIEAGRPMVVVGDRLFALSEVLAIAPTVTT